MAELDIGRELQLRKFWGFLLFCDRNDVGFEGRSSHKHFVGHDTYTPDINFFVVALKFQLFRTDIGEAAYLSHPMR